MRVRVLALVLVIGPVACGARTALNAHSTRECSSPTPPPSHCTAWLPAASARAIGSWGTFDVSFTPIATSCGVLVGWTSNTSSGGPDDVLFYTSVVAWDGSSTSPLTHAGLSAHVPGNPGWWEIAENHGTFGAVAIIDQGGGFPGSSRFVRLDSSGVEQGEPVVLDPLSGALGLAGSGFSCLGGTPNDAAITLQQIDVDGSVTKTSLPPSQQAFATRLVFDDGSFLLHTGSSWDSDQQNWLQHFDAHGVALAPRVTLTNGEYGVSGVALVATDTGAIATWTSDGLYTAALDYDGNVTSSVQTLADLGGYSYLLARANGDVVVAWQSGDEPRTFVQALAPDATPRGPATDLSDAVNAVAALDGMGIVVEPNGQRALFLYLDDYTGIKALPLRCAD